MDTLPIRFQYDAFISYTSEDEQAAESLSRELTELGLKVWVEKNSLIGGQPWHRIIQDAIRSSRYFLVLISQRWSNRERYVHEELHSAVRLSIAPEKRHSVIPILLDDAPVPLPLRRFRCISLVGNREKGVRQVISAMSLYSPEKDQVILGFDLGHGESAFATTTVMSQKTPGVLDIMGRQSVLTAVARDETGEILIGDDAYRCTGPKSLALAFKNRNMDDKGVRDSLRIFVQECFRILRETGKVESSPDTIVIVGTPSGWSESDRERYKELLIESGISQIELRPESRAAFLEAYDGKEIPQVIQGYALIIDIGSSTTDYTVVRDFKEHPVDDFGHNRLGGYLIDKQILDLTLHREQAEMARWAECIARDSTIKAKCLLKCREVKERFFNNFSARRGAVGTVSDHFWVEGMPSPLIISINPQEMERILSSPLDDLDGETWKGCFSRELEQIRAKETDPKLVLMTGGGSRMSFTVDLCRAVFGFEKVRVLPEPMTAIAKGLALAGRTDRKIKRFRQEISDYLESANFAWMIKQDMPALCKTLASHAFDLITRISTQRFREWKDGSIATLAEMEVKIRQDLEESLKTEGSKSFEAEIQRWLDGVGKEIETEVRDICYRYNIPEVAWGLKERASDLEISADELRYSDLIDSPAQDIAGTTVATVTLGLFVSIVTSSGTVLPIVGAVVVVIVGILVLGGVLGVIEENAKKWDIPSWGRALVSENQLRKRLSVQREEIETQISSQLEVELLAKGKFDELLASVRNKLNQNADRISLLIT